MSERIVPTSSGVRATFLCTGLADFRFLFLLAVEDTEETLEDDDGVPLLPLLEVQKDAMEDADFKKLLISLGMQPPIAGIENYWRIPTYLNAADIRMRAQIVGGEELPLNVDDIEPELAAAESDESEVASSESEEDYLDKVQRNKMNLLMFTKSDDEDEVRAPLANKIKETLMKNFDVVKEDASEDEMTTVKLIAKKLHKKRQNPHISSNDDDDDDDNNDEEMQRKVNSAFDQLKMRREKLKENKPRNENTQSNKSRMSDSEHEDIVEIEKKRKRREPDAISSDEQEQLDELYDRLHKKSEKSIKEAEKTKEKIVVDFTEDLALNSEDRSTLLEMQENDFQLRITDDDDDDDDNDKDNNIEKTVNEKPYSARLIDSDSETDDTTSNQAANNVGVNNKRQRSPSASVNAASDSDLTNEHNDVNDEIVNSMKRSNGKRRRYAIIDDDDDDDNDNKDD